MNEMKPERDNSRGAPKLGRKSIRLLSTLAFLILVLAVVLILYDHLTPVEGPHIMP